MKKKIDKFPIHGLRNERCSLETRFQISKQFTLDFCRSCPATTVGKSEMSRGGRGLEISMLEVPALCRYDVSVGICSYCSCSRFRDTDTLFFKAKITESKKSENSEKKSENSRPIVNNCANINSSCEYF